MRGHGERSRREGREREGTTGKRVFRPLNRSRVREHVVA